MIGFVSRACVIGIAGGTGSGKTTIAEAISNPTAPELVALLTPDTCYQKSARLPAEERLEPSHGRPHAFDLELNLRHIRRTVSGPPISTLVYWFNEYTRASETNETRSAPVVGHEGKMLSMGAVLGAPTNLEVAVDAYTSVRLIQCLQCGQLERGRTTDGVVNYCGLGAGVAEACPEPCPEPVEGAVEGMKVINLYHRPIRTQLPSVVEPCWGCADVIVTSHGGHDPEAPAILTAGVRSLIPCEKVGRRGSGA
jgi:uridine kinase